MHYLDFSGERMLPSMPKLLDQPFWLDPSDPHRMAAVMQVASRPLAHNYAAASGDLAARPGLTASASGRRRSTASPPRASAPSRRSTRRSPGSSRSWRSERPCSRLVPSLFSPRRSIMAPLGAQAADLVVWWEKGYYAAGGRGGQGDHRRLRAGDRQAGRARLPSSRRSFRTRSRRRSRPASRPTSPSASCLHDYIGQWAFDDRLVDLSDAIGHFSDLFDPDALAWAMLLNARPGRRPCTALPMGRHDQPRPRLEEPPGAGGLHARRHSQGVGGVLVVLVRPGAAGGAPGHGPRRHLGRRPADVGRGRRHRRSSSSSSWPPTRRTT